MFNPYKGETLQSESCFPQRQWKDADYDLPEYRLYRLHSSAFDLLYCIIWFNQFKLKSCPRGPKLRKANGPGFVHLHIPASPLQQRNPQVGVSDRNSTTPFEFVEALIDWAA